MEGQPDKTNLEYQNALAFQNLVGLLNALTERVARLQTEVYDIQARVDHIDLNTIHNRLHAHGEIMLELKDALNEVRPMLKAKKKPKRRKKK